MMDTDGFMRLRNEDFPKVHSQSSEMVHCTKPSVFCSDHLKTILFPNYIIVIVNNLKLSVLLLPWDLIRTISEK